MKQHGLLPFGFAILATGLFACGRSEPPPKKEDTVFGPTIQAKDRAVQKTEEAMEASKARLEEAMKKNDESGSR